MLRLRPYKPTDSAFVLEWLKDERTLNMWRAFRFYYPLTADQLDQYWDDFLGDENAWIFTALDGAGTPVGHFAMYRADYNNNSIHMGYIVIDPASRGKGYGKEMVGLALKYASRILHMRMVTLGVFSSNEAAHKCYLSCGFQDVSVNEGYETYRDEVWDYIDMVAWI